MIKNVIATLPSGSCNMCVNLGSSIPLTIISDEKIDDFLVKNLPLDTSTNLTYESEGNNLEILATFKHPIFKTKFNLLYDKVKFEMIIVPDVELYVEAMTMSKINSMGYGIGNTVDTNTDNDYANSKKLYKPYIIELEESQLTAIKAGISLTVLNIPGFWSSTDNGKFSNNLNLGPEVYIDNGFYPTSGLVIKFPVGSIKTNYLNSAILTSNNFNEERITFLENTNKDFIEKHSVFLSL